MPRQEIRQVIRARFIISQPGEFGSSSVKLVAMGAGQALHAEFSQHLVQGSSRAAIGVRDKNMLELCPTFLYLCSHCTRDFLGPIVQVRRQALNLQVRPAVQPLQLNNFVGERATGDDQYGGLRHLRSALFQYKLLGNLDGRRRIAAIGVGTDSFAKLIV